MGLSTDQKQNASVALGTCVVGGAAVVGATQTDHTAPILAFVGAILVALLTAYTSERRQKAALRAEDRRHRATLESDALRLDRQLRHDRHLSDLADIRTVLEGELDAFDERFRAASALLRDSPDRETALRENHKAIQRHSHATNRLQIRLGDNDPILLASSDAKDEFAELYRVASRGDNDAFDEQTKLAYECYRRIVVSAKARFGTSS